MSLNRGGLLVPTNSLMQLVANCHEIFFNVVKQNCFLKGVKSKGEFKIHSKNMSG